MCKLFYRSFRISFIRNNDISDETLTTSTHTHTFLLLLIQWNFRRIALLKSKIFQGNQFFVRLGEGSFVRISSLGAIPDFYSDFLTAG